jgi:hypothetical protein
MNTSARPPARRESRTKVASKFPDHAEQFPVPRRRELLHKNPDFALPIQPPKRGLGQESRIFPVFSLLSGNFGTETGSNATASATTHSL